MKIYLFDTLSKKKKEFIPVDDQNVRIYACGPTVYNFAHLGNARMAVVTDLLVKVLKQKYKKVTFASNITDIDDKIIKKGDKVVPGTAVAEIISEGYFTLLSEVEGFIKEFYVMEGEYVEVNTAIIEVELVDSEEE